MSIIRYQTAAPSILTPLARLSAFQNEVDRLFDLPFFGRAHNGSGWVPALDLYQDKNGFTIRAELPGMKKDDITLSLHDGFLTLTGQRPQEAAPEGKSAIRNERPSGRFERSVSLPAPVDSTRIAASYEDGILTVTLPKAEEVRPRQIEINVK